MNKRKRDGNKKRQEKEEATMRKRKRKGNKNNSDSPAWFCPHCLESETSDDKVWMECDQCQFWYHASCVGYNEQSTSALASVTFVCMPNMRQRQRRYEQLSIEQDSVALKLFCKLRFLHPFIYYIVPYTQWRNCPGVVAEQPRWWRNSPVLQLLLNNATTTKYLCYKIVYTAVICRIER